MALIVQKFGGTSVADTKRIKEVTRIIKSEIELGNQVIVVVSAMAGVTNHLINLCKEVSKLHTEDNMAEYDLALCSGEMVTTALVTLSLQENGLKSRSILGWQLPILTCSHYGKALVDKIDTNLLVVCLNQNIIPVIAGFQGVTEDNRCTTLGRGGSDTTAAIISAAVRADRCDIYTDVDGIFTTDPKIVRKAKKLMYISFEEMLAFTSSGAKVLTSRCVEIAMQHSVPIRVLSSFSIEKGTLITSRSAIMENRVITGIVSNNNLLQVSIEDPILNLNQIYYLMLKNSINVELMLSLEIKKKYSFIAQLNDKHRLDTLLAELKETKQITDSSININISMISIIGYGIANDSSVMKVLLNKLDTEGILVLMIQVLDIKIVLLVNTYDHERAINVLHEFFELDK